MEDDLGLEGWAMDKELAAFLCRFANVPEGCLHQEVDLGALLDRYGYSTEPDDITYRRDDLIAKYGTCLPIWKLVAVLMHAGGVSAPGVKEAAPWGRLGDLRHDWCCGRPVPPLIDVAFSLMNPHMAQHVGFSIGVTGCA